MAASKPAFKMMNATLPMFVLHLQSSDDAVLRDQLRARVGQAPEFFQATPVVLSLAALADSDYVPDWATLCDFLRELGMRPAGIMDASEAQRESALAYGLAQFPDRVSRKPVEAAPADTADAAPSPAEAAASAAVAQAELPLAAASSVTPATVAAPAPAATPAAIPAAAAVVPEPTLRAAERMPPLVIDKPVRTGQRIHAQGTDLIVLAVVNAGAELIADGDIHVYAPLRGRALAGARGNAQARIYSQSMEAELVSIAGNFKILEDVPPALKGKPAQVRCDGDKIVMQPLGDIRN